MEKVITIIAEIAVAALVLAGLVLLVTNLMDPATEGGVYNSMDYIVAGVMDDVNEAIGIEAQ